MLSTAQRKSEISELRSSEVNLDSGVIQVPAERMKAKGAAPGHLVGQALQILASRRAAALQDALQVSRAIYDDRSGAALHRVVVQLRKATGIDFRLHDLRRTAASMMSDMDVDPFVTGLVLAHAPATVTHRHYLVASWARRKCAAMQVWDRTLAAILNPESAPAKVVSITGKVGEVGFDERAIPGG